MPSTDKRRPRVHAGMLPLARELLRQGTIVIIAANTLPAINDITAAELEQLLPQICAADSVLCKGVSERRLQVVPSGSGLPVIDLSKVKPCICERYPPSCPGRPACRQPACRKQIEQPLPHPTLLTMLINPAAQVSAELAEAAQQADLIILEGMGRSIETNLGARFR